MRKTEKGIPVPLLWESDCQAFLIKDPVAASLEPTDRELLLKLGGLLGSADYEGQIAPVSYTHLDVYKRQVC